MDTMRSATLASTGRRIVVRMIDGILVLFLASILRLSVSEALLLHLYWIAWVASTLLYYGPHADARHRTASIHFRGDTKTVRLAYICRGLCSPSRGLVGDTCHDMRKPISSRASRQIR